MDQCVWEMSNLSSNAVVIDPGAVLCQVQTCELVSGLPEGEDNVIPDEAWLKKIDISDPKLTAEQREDILRLVSSWHDVFSKHDIDVGLTGLVKHRINLTDFSPFKQRHRQIPHSMYKEVGIIFNNY